MKMLRVADVASKTGLAVPTIWWLARTGGFPKGVKLSPKVTAWDEADVDNWLAMKKEQSNGSYQTEGATEGCT